MNAKKADKIATGILYAVSGVIVLILAALLIYILAERNSTYFVGIFNTTIQSLSSWWWDWYSAF